VCCAVSKQKLQRAADVGAAAEEEVRCTGSFSYIFHPQSQLL
jgi:hypothetical protein